MDPPIICQTYARQQVSVQRAVLILNIDTDNRGQDVGDSIGLWI